MSITNHITQVHVTGPNFTAAAYVRLSYVHCADSSIFMLSQPINANDLSNVSIIDNKATTIT